MRMQTGLLVVAGIAGSVQASVPQMGGNMSHLLITIFNHQVFIGFESPAMSTVEMLEGSGNFDGAASVLDGTGHNSQFGWLANGFISLPSNSGVFVRTLEQSPHLSVYSEFGFEPILGTGGSDPVWQWDGTMTHNWYASDVKGPLHARYEVYVGDQNGNPLDGWVAGQVELNFIYGGDLSDRIGVLGGGLLGGASVPAPGSIAVAGVGLILGRRRR